MRCNSKPAISSQAYASWQLFHPASQLWQLLRATVKLTTSAFRICSTVDHWLQAVNTELQSTMLISRRLKSAYFKPISNSIL